MATENRHIPVLLNEVLAALEPVAHERPAATFVDCTLGGGGHTEAMLSHFPGARVLGCDVDQTAIDRVKTRLAPLVDGARLGFFHGNFSTLVDVSVDNGVGIDSRFQPPWNGMLADLGYSSNQLENADYGMSFSIDAPLDMRLGRPPTGETAWELLVESEEANLADIFRAYGEIQGAGRIARIIKQAVQSGEVENSTASLAGLLERISGGRDRHKIHPATQVFQALRIAVNDELRVLDHFLEGAILKVSPRGRIVIITFHSLEDRIVKRWGARNAHLIEAVTKKPLVASQEEIDSNPRSRSAKLRVYQKR